MMYPKQIILFLVPLIGCHGSEAQGTSTHDKSACPDVSTEFVVHVQRTLSDSSDLFRGAYPPATPLTCELLTGLQEALKDDSARYCFERLAMEYWNEDAAARITFAYIHRHVDFHLTMATIAHWNEDNRIRGLRALQNYRRIRPQVCATRDHYARLEEQDRQAVRYLIRVLETTPMHISGSENATIHGIYIQTVMQTLDLFTGQEHSTTGDMRRTLDMNELRLEQALTDWRKWLAP